VLGLVLHERRDAGDDIVEPAAGDEHHASDRHGRRRHQRQSGALGHHETVDHAQPRPCRERHGEAERRGEIRHVGDVAYHDA